eukprot:Awhi_evm1s3016
MSSLGESKSHIKVFKNYPFLRLFVYLYVYTVDGIIISDAPLWPAISQRPSRKGHTKQKGGNTNNNDDDTTNSNNTNNNTLILFETPLARTLDQNLNSTGNNNGENTNDDNDDAKNDYTLILFKTFLICTLLGLTYLTIPFFSRENTNLDNDIAKNYNTFTVDCNIFTVDDNRNAPEPLFFSVTDGCECHEIQKTNY